MSTVISLTATAEAEITRGAPTDLSDTHDTATSTPEELEGGPDPQEE